MNNRIIMPGREIPQGKFDTATPATMTQIPIFPIPVQSNDSYLLYALCMYAIESGVYTDMPNILPQLTAMKQGLEMAYTKLGIPMFEYRKFVVKVEKEVNEDIEKGEEKDVEMGEESSEE